MIYKLLEKSSRLYAGNIAVSCGEVSITYRKLYENVNRLAAWLKEAGAQKGDNVALLVGNSTGFVEAFFAVNACGAVIVPLYANTGSKKLLDIIQFYNIRYIISVKKHKDTLCLVVKNGGLAPKGIFYLDGEYEPCGSGHAGTYEGKNAEDTGDTALIMFSSGTTRMPKGIMLSGRNITSNVEGISHYLRLTCSDRILLVKNINHASSITGEMLVSIANGCTLFLTESIPSASLILDMIQSNAITVFFAVPALLSSMLGHRYFDRYDLSTLRVINFYGAGIGINTLKEAVRGFKGINLIYSYGLTEASPRVTFIMGEDLLKKEGSSGKPIKDVSVYILDSDGRPVASGHIGEIAVKGPNVMCGYYGNEELTAKALRNGLLHTGDMGCLDGDGYLYVTGRKDNLIIKAGKNIYPEEIEGVIAGVRGVKDVLVRGEADELAGEETVAYITVNEGFCPNIREIFIHCKENLEDYKIPGRIFIVENLERTPSGKIVRRQEIAVKAD